MIAVLFGLIFFLLGLGLIPFIVYILGAPSFLSKLGGGLLRLAGKAAGGHEVVEHPDNSYTMANFKPDRPPRENQSWSLSAPFGLTYEDAKGCLGDAVLDGKPDTETYAEPTDLENKIMVVENDDLDADYDFYCHEEEVGSEKANIYLPRVTQIMASFEPGAAIQRSVGEATVEEGGDTSGLPELTMVKATMVSLGLGAATTLLFFAFLV